MKNLTQGPRVHLNGTGKNALVAEAQTAIVALTDAQEALRNMTVHMRDYYPLENGQAAFTEQREARSRRITTLEFMLTELAEYVADITDQH